MQVCRDHIQTVFGVSLVFLGIAIPCLITTEQRRIPSSTKSAIHLLRMIMAYTSLLTLLTLASSACGASIFAAPGSSGAGVRSGQIPTIGTIGDSINSFAAGSDGAVARNSQQLGQGVLPTPNGDDAIQFFEQAEQSGQRFFQDFSSGATNVQSIVAPQYPQHTQARSGLVPGTITITNKVTQTHTLRVPSTSDVWVTSVSMMKMPVTQLTTQRSYVPEAANTVTSVIRITKTPIAVVTRTEEIYPTKTLVSVFTRFVTETETVELWQNIVHRATNYEVLTVPVVETQTLLQRLFSTTTVTRVVNVTSVQPVFPRSGEIASTPAPYYRKYAV